MPPAAEQADFPRLRHRFDLLAAHRAEGDQREEELPVDDAPFLQHFDRLRHEALVRMAAWHGQESATFP